VEKATFREAPQEDPKKEELVTPAERDNLILNAAIEFGPDYFYDIRNGTLGATLYIEAPNKFESSRVRKVAPGHWKGLYVVVLYHTDPYSGSAGN
tara:strand:+ start:215 stop:499 length:285 start_codon:yes stop_codon:yes gene_type:complete